MPNPPLHIAIVGAGVSGAACARRLALAGHHAVLFDKARGPGGRMSTRRGSAPADASLPITVDQPGATPFAFDHGAQYFTARHPDFRAVVEAGTAAGWIAPWTPRIAGKPRAGSLAGKADAPADAQDTAEVPATTASASAAATSTDAPARDARHVALPGMPELARRLADGLPLHLQAQVTALQREPDGRWRLRLGETTHPEPFDVVLLAMPAEQAAALLAGHRPDWAAAARSTPMLPCWTLMAITDAPDWPFDATWPAQGPLAWLARNDSKPGRPGATGQAHWVAQARADWSARHLERDAAEIVPLLLDALRAALGPDAAALGVRHAVAHRWRYARPAEASPLTTGAPWWDAALGLGACGDFLGGARVEAAFLNGEALARSVIGSGNPGG
ncbi:NAD(P)/FAD-dependent oxidoreductase [Derxia gummosa]|uniref:NAD(P)/FAD-dependent oxidoreductase n=1 Tax=Derxia gummosa DSM 723 TaxID=1121388 RepID=A0A8B6X525_9BURK|nr:NAD(P)-binding protein [Derxia gummosa]